MITTGDSYAFSNDLRLTISSFTINSRSPLAGIKSCNYLENLAALDDARKRGFYEAVRRNELGEIASACSTNLFWLKNGKLFTPSLETGCLAGTTREFILENLKCEEVKAGEAEIYTAENLFICSAGIGIVAVAALDDKHFEPPQHEIMHLILRFHSDKKTRTSAERVK